jgi:NADH-quinone oxidoreductase subunit D
VKKENIIEIPFGPNFSICDDSQLYRLKIRGNTVEGVVIETGYRHMGIEKMSESMHFNQTLLLSERICGTCSFSHSYAYAKAVEDLAGIKIPVRASLIRTLTGEIERISSHLLWVGHFFRLLGKDDLWMLCWKYREPVLEMCEKIFGNRIHYSVIRIGGISRDVEPEELNFIKKRIRKIIKAIKKLKEITETDILVKKRTQGTGILDHDSAVEFSISGPVARASGVNIDLRKDVQCTTYSAIDFDVPVKREGDVYARLILRIEEITQSALIIQQCLDKLKAQKGTLRGETGEIPEGEGIGRHESPRGEIFHYIRSHGGNVPYRHRINTPSYMNLPALETMIKGADISDAALIIASLDLCYGCAERMQKLVRHATHKGKCSVHGLINLSRHKSKLIEMETDCSKGDF